MRVLFLSSYFPRPSKPLIGTWALQQAKALARVADVRVVCCTSYVPGILRVVRKSRPWVDIPRTYQWENVTTEYLKLLYYPLKPFKKWAYGNPARQMGVAWWSVRRRLLESLRQFKPDVIYAHHTAVNGYFAERLHRVTGIPYVITDHDFSEIADCAKLPGRKHFFVPVITAAFRNVCVAKRMEEDMRRIFPSSHATTVYNGINPHSAEIFTTPRPPELQGKVVIFSAGMFAPRKGFALLVEAFGGIAEKYPTAILRIGGDGEQRPEVEAAIAKFGLAGRVQLLGLLPQKQIFQEMAWSDAFALIGWDEPFATVFIEAMGAGKPIVTASDGGINDLVRDRVHGLVVPPKNLPAAVAALDTLLADPQLRQEMGRNAKVLVEDRMTWDANSREMLKLFEKAVAMRAAQ